MADIPISCARFGIAISWDQSEKRLDLDIQGVAFDRTGKPLDAVFYNNMKALGRGMTHSGDEQTGSKAGLDETVWVHFDKLPTEVGLIVFVVALYQGGHLNDIRDGYLHLLENTVDGEIFKSPIERSNEEVDLVGALLPAGSAWAFRPLQITAQDGRHFIDILEPTIGDFVRSVIPCAPKRIKAAFKMEKDSVVDLPQTAQIKHVKACLGWDASGGKVDLDVSAVLFKQDGTNLGACYYGQTSFMGVQHSGDNLTGRGEGDDETIYIPLETLSSAVHRIVFTVNIFSPGRSFAMVANPYCRVVNATTGGEFAKYLLHEAGHQQGLIISQLFWSPGSGRWSFQALGHPCSGHTWSESMPYIASLLGVSSVAVLPECSCCIL